MGDVCACARKIKYGENGETAYGLIADVLVGNLVLGREMKILNENNSITLDDKGITIKDKEGETFKVTTDGNVCLRGEVNAKSGLIGGYKIEKTQLTSGNVGMSSDTTDGEYAFWAGNSDKASAPFSVTNKGDVAAYCEYKKEDGTYECSLRYDEFIALNISEIQKLKNV